MIDVDASETAVTAIVCEGKHWGVGFERYADTDTASTEFDDRLIEDGDPDDEEDPGGGSVCDGAGGDVYGSWKVGGQRIGVAAGCAKLGFLQFAFDDEPIIGRVYSSDSEDVNITAAQAWFVKYRPFGRLKGTVTGSALAKPPVLMTWAELRAAAKTVSYRTLRRNYERYEDKLLYFRVQVFQELGDGEALVLVTRGSYGIWTNIAHLTYPASKRLVEDDIVKVVATGNGIYEYTTLFGAEKRVPDLDAVRLKIE